jgi:hypothetical protein
MRCDHQDQHLPMKQNKIKSMRGYIFRVGLSRKIVLPKEYQRGNDQLPTEKIINSGKRYFNPWFCRWAKK